MEGREVIPPKMEVNGGEGGVAPPPCVEMEVNGGSGDEQVEMGKEGPHSRRKYVGEGTTPPCLCRNPSKTNWEDVEPSPGCHVTGGLSPPTHCHISVSKKEKKKKEYNAGTPLHPLFSWSPSVSAS